MQLIIQLIISFIDQGIVLYGRKTRYYSMDKGQEKKDCFACYEDKGGCTGIMVRAAWFPSETKLLNLLFMRVHFKKLVAIMILPSVVIGSKTPTDQDAIS